MTPIPLPPKPGRPGQPRSRRPAPPTVAEPDELIYVIGGDPDTRTTTTYAEFVDRSARWLVHHPEAFVMADGHLHRATCAEVGDLSDVQWLIGVHKRADLLIERAMRDWEGYVCCSRCAPD